MKEEKVTKITYNEDGRVSKEEVFLNGELFETVDRTYCIDRNTGSPIMSSKTTTNFKTNTIQSELYKFKYGLITETLSSINEGDIIHHEHVENTYDEYENLILSIITKDNELLSIDSYEYDDRENDDRFTASFMEFEGGICKRYIDSKNTTIRNSDGTSKQIILNKNHYTGKELERNIIKYDKYGSAIYSKYEDFVNSDSTIITSLNSFENDVLVCVFDTITISGKDPKYKLITYTYDNNRLVNIVEVTTDDITDSKIDKMFSINKNKED